MLTKIILRIKIIIFIVINRLTIIKYYIIGWNYKI